jgi:hypothetical protein
MLLPADLLSSTFMPWALAAPALPLLLMLYGKSPFTGLNVSILLVCVVTMLTNMIYGILPKTPPSIRNDIHLTGIIIESALSLVLIWNLIANGLLRKVIIAVAAIMIGGLTLMMAFDADIADIKYALSIAYLAIAILSGIALFKISESTKENFLTADPAFWTGAGLSFHFGLMALLLTVLPAINLKDWSMLPGFSLLYLISNSIRYIVFSAAVHTESIREFQRKS